MSWLRVDDGFPENGKASLLSDAAIAMWLRCACWARKRENQYTNGFVPAALLPKISHLPAAKAKRLALELVNANAGGTKEHGLWEPEDDGWRFHDWQDYLPPEEKMTPQEAASIAGKRSAQVRRERNGTAQPTKPRTTPNDTEPFEDRSIRTDAPNEHRTSRTPDPIPDPIPKPQLQQRSDEPIHPDVVARLAEGQIPCPVPLDIPETTLAQWEQNPGIPRATALAMINEFAVSSASDRTDRRFRSVWVKCAIKAVQGRWSGRNKRPGVTSDTQPGKSTVPFQPWDGGSYAAGGSK